MTALALTGCQNLTEQLTNKIAEGVINSSTNGEVKVNMADLKNGKISVTTKDGTINMNGNDQGGNMTMTDKSGQTTTMTSDSGDARPASIPADMPSLPNGKDFAWFTMNEMGTVSFSVDSADVKTPCDQEVAMLTSAGWQPGTEGFSAETSDSVLKNYQKNDVNLTLSCSLSDGKVTVGLTETKKAS